VNEEILCDDLDKRKREKVLRLFYRVEMDRALHPARKARPFSERFKFSAL
jgi:hypothetical protein